MTRSSSPAHDRAREFPGMIGCFRAAPNSGPTSKSLPGPQFSFGLDLVNCNSNIGQISHNVPNTSELCSLLCNPHYRPPLNTTILLTGWQLVSGWSQQNLKIDSNAKRFIITHIPTLWDFVHVLATFDISFKYVPAQWIHFPLDQDRNCLIKKKKKWSAMNFLLF